MFIKLRNRVNHFILNKLLVVRYYMRKNPLLIKCIIGAEALCVKTGLIFHGQKKHSIRHKEEF